MAIHIFDKDAQSEQVSTTGKHTLTIDFHDVLEFAKQQECYLLGKENQHFILAKEPNKLYRLEIGYDYNNQTMEHDKPALYIQEISGYVHDAIDSRFEYILDLIKNESNHSTHLRSIFNVDFLDTINHHGDILNVKHAQQELKQYNKKHGTQFDLQFQSVTTEEQIGLNCLVAVDGDKMILKAPNQDGAFGEWDDFSNYAKRYSLLKEYIQEHLNKFENLNLNKLSNELDDQYMIYILKSDNVDKYDSLKVLGTNTNDYHTAINQATRFSKEDVIQKMKDLQNDGVSCFVFDDYDKRFFELMSTKFDLTQKFVDQWIEQSSVFASLKQTPTEIVQEFTKGYLPVNPLKSIELNLLNNGYIIENREVLDYKIGKEQNISGDLKILGQDKGVHLSIYRMPSGNYETTAYSVDYSNKQTNTSKLKM